MRCSFHNPSLSVVFTGNGPGSVSQGARESACMSRLHTQLLQHTEEMSAVIRGEEGINIFTGHIVAQFFADMFGFMFWTIGGIWTS